MTGAGLVPPGFIAIDAGVAVDPAEVTALVGRISGGTYVFLRSAGERRQYVVSRRPFSEVAALLTPTQTLKESAS